MTPRDRMTHRARQLTPTGDLGVRAAALSAPEAIDAAFAAIVEDSVLGFADATQTADQAPGAMRWTVQASTTRFADVCGLESVKRTLLRRYATPRRRPAAGLLMYGPAGCGKAMLARGLAGELGAGFVQVLVRDLVRPDLTAEAAGLTQLFNLAKTAGRVVVLLDGLEALSAAEPELVDQLIAELAQAHSARQRKDAHLIVLASTDEPWAIDARLRGALQFGDEVFVAPPSRRARRELFIRMLPRRTSPTVSVRRLAHCTSGISGADIAAICAQAGEEAALDAIEGDFHLITMGDFVWWNSQTARTAEDWARRYSDAQAAAAR